MSRRFGLLGLLLVACGLIAVPAAQAQTASQDVMAHAVQTVNDLKRDPAFGNAQRLIQRARGVLIVPRLYKAGFFFGGSGGEGVLLVRRGPRTWSDPAFFYIASASFGLQIGAQQSEMILIALTQRGLNALLTNGFKFGATADIAVAMLGSSAGGATTTNAGADIVIWASTAGAYAGLTVDGSIIKPSPEHDRGYYGRPVTTRQIFSDEVRAPVSADRLRADLASIA